MFRQYHLRDFKFSLILWVSALSILGIMIIGSAQRSSQNRQILGLVLGLKVCQALLYDSILGRRLQGLLITEVAES